MPRPAGRENSLYFDYPHFAFVPPPELNSGAVDHAVAIIGAGPVGLAAALELHRHGVPVVVLDEKDTVNDGSRAICIARHSLEILQQLGVSERFVAKALGWTHGTSFYRGEPVYRLEMPHSEEERFHPMYNLQQQYMELYLAEAARERDGIDLRWQSRVTGVEAGDDSVVLRVATPRGDYNLRARYVLAADGARSVVRHALNLPLRGDAWEGRYVIVDIRMQSDYPTERRAFFDPPANPGSTVLIHRQPDDIWRVDYQIDAGTDEAKALSEESIRARVSAILEMVGETGEWELEWWSLYKAYTLALDDYRCGRVFFLGDAAHLVPIFGVRGLNSGFADAANIGWKLAWVINGAAPEALLDSYSPERRGATLDIFRNAVRSTRFMTPPTYGYTLMRDAALSLSLDHEFSRVLLNPRQSQPYTYHDSTLTGFHERDREFTGGPRAGAPLINRRTGEGYLLDYLGRGFTGLYFADRVPLPAPIREAFSRLRSAIDSVKIVIITRGDGSDPDFPALRDTTGRVFEGYGADDGTFYLVRPDRHVCARWREFRVEEAEQAFAMATGRRT